MVEPSSPSQGQASLTVRVTGQWILGRPRAYWMPAAIPWLGLGETRYHPPVEPRAMSKAAAALVVAHEEASMQEAASRRRWAEVWMDILEPLISTGAFLPIGQPDPGAAGYLRFPLLSSRGMVGFPSDAEATASGIMPGYPRALPDLSAARDRQVPARALTGASTLARRLVTLPTHSRLRVRDRREITALLERYPA
jgi:hypothetical protein